MQKKDSRTQTLTASLVFQCVVAALSAFNAGYNIGAPNQVEKTITACDRITLADDPGTFQQCFPTETTPTLVPMDPAVWGLCTALYPLGGLLGSLISSHVATYFGRRKGLALINFPFVLGGLLIALSTSVSMIAVGRFIVGAASGLATALTAMYIGEIATPKYRGALGSLLQLLLVIGILIAQSIGIPLSAGSLQDNSGLGWRIAFGLTVLPSILQLFLLPFCVESPRYLVLKGRLPEAKAALQRVRGPAAEWSIEGEYRDMLVAQGYAAPDESLATTKSDDSTVVSKSSDYDVEESPDTRNAHKSGSSGGTAQLTFGEIMRNKKLRATLAVALTVQCCQQLTGINTVIMYSTNIFNTVFDVDTSRIMTVVVAIVNLCSTIASLILVDRLGRKALLMTSEVGMTICATVMVIASVYPSPVTNIIVVVSVAMFVASFAVGLGPIPWLIIPELFPTHALSVCNALAGAVNYLSNFAICQIFPIIVKPFGPYAFLPFVILSFLAALFTATFVKETKGKSLEELGMESEGAK